MKTIRERASSFEEEVGEQKSMLDRLRHDLMATKEEYHGAVQEGQTYKQQAQKLQIELDGSRQQEHMLSEQVGISVLKLLTYTQQLCSYNR